MQKIARPPVLSEYRLPRNEVHVWRIPLGVDAAQILGMKAILAIDEQQRAARFRAPLDRTAYVIGRGVLRLIVAQCIGISAERLRFEYNQFGKPYLADASSKIPLQFNVSHSGRLVLIALARGRAVGIDVEQTQDGFEMEPIAQLVLQSLPAHLRRDAFFACWTRKEAYIKAVGNGLSLPLNQFDVCILPGKPACLLSTRPIPLKPAVGRCAR